MEQFLEIDIDKLLLDYMNINDLTKFRINKDLKKKINKYVFLNDKINTCYDNVFKIITILTKAYDNVDTFGVKSYYHGHLGSSFACYGSKSGIIIESYYSSFISKIYTPYGSIRATGDCAYYGSCKKLNDYLHTHFTMVEIAKSESNNITGCSGPWYLLTHIDNIEIDHPSIKLYISIDHMYKDNIICINNHNFIDILFNKQIERLMISQKIKDPHNIISRLITDETFYNDAVILLKKRLGPGIPSYLYTDHLKCKYAFIYKLLLHCHIDIFN